MASKTTIKRRRRSRGKHPWLWRFTLLNLVFLAGVYLSHAYVAESAWWSMFLTYIPQLLFLVPAGILTVLCVRRRLLGMTAMNVAAVVLGLWFIAGFVWHPFGPDASKPRIKVMTYNVHGGKQGYDLVARCVDSVSPDVICFQEAGNIRAARVPEMFPAYKFRFAGGLAVGSRLPILEDRVIPLHPGQSGLAVKVQSPFGPVQIVDVHLVPTNIQHDVKHGEAALSRSMTRAAAAHSSQVGALLAEFGHTKDRLVLCGDFNAPPYGIQYGRLCDRFSDSFAACGTGFGYTVPARFPFIRIDLVFANDLLKPQRAYVPGDVASDHRPVVAELSPR